MNYICNFYYYVNYISTTSTVPTILFKLPNVGCVDEAIVNVALFATSTVPLIGYPEMIVKLVALVPFPTIILLPVPNVQAASLEGVAVTI